MVLAGWNCTFYWITGKNKFVSRVFFLSLSTEGKHVHKSNASSYSPNVSRAQHVSKAIQVRGKLLNKFTKGDIKNIHRYCSPSPAASLSALQQERTYRNYIREGKGGAVIGDLSKETTVLSAFVTCFLPQFGCAISQPLLPGVDSPTEWRLPTSIHLNSPCLQ